MKQKRMFMLVVMLSAITGILLATTQKSFAFLLVQDGQPRATIIVPENSSPKVQRAAEYSNNIFNKVAGPNLPTLPQRTTT